MEIGKRYRVTIEDLGEGGEGVAKVGGLTVFVPGVVLDDEVEMEITELKKNYAIGQVIAVTEPSPHRVISPCPDYPECGGCQLLDTSYQAQLVWKERHVSEVLKRIGGLDLTVEPIIGMDEPYHFRNKMSYPVKQTELGLYQRNTHDIVEIQDCQIHPPIAGEVLDVIRQHLGKTIQGYNELHHKGGLRQVMIRYGKDLDQLMVVLVTCDKTNLRPLVEDLKAFPNIRTIIENKNCRAGNHILGDKNIILYGDGVIEEVLGPDRFAIDTHSFYQVNTEQLKKLYNLVREFANCQGHELVYDIYAGMGTIGTYLSRDCRKVVSIEVVPQAIEAGQQAALRNDVENIEFIRGKAEDVMGTLNKQGLKPDLVIVDPPRKGLDDRLIDSLMEVKPQRIIYVSCKPSTLARDLRRLVEGGYQVQRVRPVDMFPHTTHVETVCLLTRISSM